MNPDTVQQDLLKRRREIVDRLGRVTVDARHSEGLSADFAEQAVERENDQVLADLDEAIRLEIADIDAALDRLADSRYGICERCGNHIPPQRLQALPYAVRCVTCSDAKHING